MAGDYRGEVSEESVRNIAASASELAALLVSDQLVVDDGFLLRQAQNLAQLPVLLLGEVQLRTTLNGAGGPRIRFGQLLRKDQIDELSEFIASANGKLQKLIPPPNKLEFIEMLGTLFRSCASWREEAIEPMLDDIAALRRAPENYSLLISPELEDAVLARQSSKLYELERTAHESVENLKMAAGEAGQERLAQTFAATAKSEEDRARFWSRCVFLCIFAGIALPIVVLSVDSMVLTQVTGLVGTLIKLLVGLPLYATAAYCARIAADHRDTARHMKILTAQIDSVRAYVDQLPKAQRDEIVLMLGRRAFSRPELIGRDTGKVTAMPEEVVPLLEKAMEVARDSIRR